MRKKRMETASIRNRNLEMRELSCEFEENDLFTDSIAYNQRINVINKQGFDEVEATSEYMETHYYK